MRRVIRTGSLDWEQTELLEKLLDVRKLPEIVIIEGVEDE